MEHGDLVYHKLLGQGVVIDIFLSKCVVKFKSGLKQLPIESVQTSLQEIKQNKKIGKDYDEQYFDINKSREITNDML